MENKPKKRAKKRNDPTRSVSIDLPVYIPELQNNLSNSHSDYSIIDEQDYAYQLSMIADMEKQEKEKMAEIESMRQKKIKDDIEMRDFHIKQILRKLKLGTATSCQDKVYIELLESWMNTEDIDLVTTYANIFHSYLEKNIRMSKDTKEYLIEHIHV
jgi:hypothetical protein